MTLLLNLVGPRGIHQSSDFRLTDVMTRRSIEDQFGSKQLHHMTNTWTAWISFTGFAQIGQRKTRDWILESLKAAAGSADVAMAELAATAALELRRVPRKDWFLTIVATVIESSPATRLFVISCVDRPAKPPLSQPLDHFEVYELSINNPQVLIFGSANTVTKADRKFLEKLNRGKADHAEIRRSLARVNARSAKRSNGTVSEGCLVSSTTLDGRNALENFGGTPGATADVAGSAQMLDVITKAHKGDRPTFRQGREATAAGMKEVTFEPINVLKGSTLVARLVGESPALFVTDSSGNTFREAQRLFGAKAIDEDAAWAKLEEGLLAGPSHTVVFSSTNRSATFNGPDGSKYGLMEIVGMNGDVVLVKNRVAKITLGSVTVHITPAFKHQAQAMQSTWDVRSVLSINGVEPHNWAYGVDMVLEASGGIISIQRNAVALRSADFAAPLSCLTESEELVVVSSTRPAMLKISKDQPSASCSVEARLFLRDIPRNDGGRVAGP
jgi:hypothetical protein